MMYSMEAVANKLKVSKVDIHRYINNAGIKPIIKKGIYFDDYYFDEKMLGQLQVTKFYEENPLRKTRESSNETFIKSNSMKYKDSSFHNFASKRMTPKIRKV